MKTFSIVSLNISRVKGIPKTPVERVAFKPDWGIVGDAHAGPGKRQVSLLAIEDIEGMVALGAAVSVGDFAENITTKGIDVAALSVGARIRIDALELEITQIGKECHHGCAIREKIGDCIMPRRGVFARVVVGGEITIESIGVYDF